METIGNRVRRLREGKGVARKDLARVAGMSYSGLSDLESGKAKSTTKLHRLATALGVDVDYLETGKESQSQSVELDLEMLKSAIVSVKEALRTLGLELDAFLAAPLIAYAYAERTALPRDMTKDEYRAFDAMVTAKLQGELGNVGQQRSVVDASKGGTQAAASHGKKALSGKQ
jgi:transcriptional regulator with XRE-family HTH domain